jgi:hypothetical protein
VAELAGDAGDAAIGRTAQDQAEADAGRELHVGHVGHTAAGTEEMFAHGSGVGVVLEVDRHPEPRLELQGGSQPAPAREDALGVDEAGERVDRRGQAGTDADHMAGVDAGVGERRARELGGELEALQRLLVDGERRPLVRDDPAAEVAHGGADVTMAEVQADGVRRAGGE